MIETTFNMFDAIVLTITALSALLSFFRGFIREVLSLGAWIAASIITLYLFPHVAAKLEPHVNSTVIASGFAAMGTFLIALLTFSIFNSLLMKLFKKGQDVGWLDNFLGLSFGVLRAGLLISLGYLILKMVLPENEYPEWLETAKTRPFVEQGADILAKIAPDYLEQLAPLAESLEDPDATNSLDNGELIDSEPLSEGNEGEGIAAKRLEQLLQGIKDPGNAEEEAQEE